MVRSDQHRNGGAIEESARKRHPASTSGLVRNAARTTAETRKSSHEQSDILIVWGSSSLDQPDQHGKPLPIHPYGPLHSPHDNR